MLEFGHNLKKYRLISKISQVELANAVGIKQGTIANYENGNMWESGRLTIADH